MPEPSLAHLISVILFEADPIGINFSTNADEYDPEAKEIAGRLDYAASADQLTVLIHSIFIRWFDARIAGPADRFAEIASRIWQLGAEFSTPGTRDGQS